MYVHRVCGPSQAASGVAPLGFSRPIFSLICRVVPPSFSSARFASASCPAPPSEGPSTRDRGFITAERNRRDRAGALEKGTSDHQCADCVRQKERMRCWPPNRRLLVLRRRGEAPAALSPVLSASAACLNQSRWLPSGTSRSSCVSLVSARCFWPSISASQSCLVCPSVVWGKAPFVPAAAVESRGVCTVAGAVSSAQTLTQQLPPLAPARSSSSSVLASVASRGHLRLACAFYLKRDARSAPLTLKVSEEPQSASNASDSRDRRAAATRRSALPDFAQVFSPRDASSPAVSSPSSLGSSSGSADGPGARLSVAGEASSAGSPASAEKAAAAAERASARGVGQPAPRRRSPHAGRGQPPLVAVTEAASQRIRAIVEEYNARIDDARAAAVVGDDDREEATAEEARAAKAPRAVGIRIGLEKRGCSGLSYTIDVATQAPALPTPAGRSAAWLADEVLDTPGGKLVVASDAVMFLVGTEVDFVDTELERKFVFKNPNEKQSCGCGKSFMA
ncbi:iron-sulfur cluster protein ISCA [Besnoitia besnoiti]|uniref:Iron-sulfur cluster protein ISCA n=1 Tax=Besnoitia besnoiti TaxID=94643 RepID=A0A2A9MBR6_BESBE|nr:iron-sulfur cluster protein ISCA [Besnoitia besnoiti]PFH34664.1 iron-sulfur cluster protein ISCA [Besnoitia besnoiti]